MSASQYIFILQKDSSRQNLSFSLKQFPVKQVRSLGGTSFLVEFQEEVLLSELKTLDKRLVKKIHPYIKYKLKD